jgi:YbbR domain-containing protein
VKKETSKSISGLLINEQGLPSQYKATFKDPEAGKVDLLVNGSSDTINNLKPDDFKLFIDLSNLNEGDHDVKIQVVGPSNINWELDKATAKVNISQAGV